MLEVSKIEKIVRESFLNIEEVISESKKELKGFKVSQAEEIKNLIIEDEGSNNLGLKMEKFQEELKKREDNYKIQISSVLKEEMEVLRYEVLSLLDQEEIKEEEIKEEEIKEEETLDLEDFNGEYFNNQNIESEFKEVTNKFFESAEKEEPFKTEELDQWIKDIKKLI